MPSRVHGLALLCAVVLLSAEAATFRKPATPAEQRANLAQRVVDAFHPKEVAAREEDAALEVKIKAKEGEESADRFHGLDSKRAQIQHMVDDLKSQEANAKDEATKATIRGKREKIEEIENQLTSHFQALSGLFDHPQPEDE